MKTNALHSLLDQVDQSRLRLQAIDELTAILNQVTKLQQFKDYVHQRLDEAGIPVEPNGKHSVHGCRIGDRLDIVLESVHYLIRYLDKIQEVAALGETDYSSAMAACKAIVALCEEFKVKKFTNQDLAIAQIQFTDAHLDPPVNMLGESEEE